MTARDLTPSAAVGGEGANLREQVELWLADYDDGRRDMQLDDDHAERFRALLTLQPSSAADAEPVAWLTGDMLHDILSSFKDRADVAEIAAKINTAIAQPHPSQQAETEGEVERYVRLAETPFDEAGLGAEMFVRFHAYLNEYVLSTEGADYEPNEFERALIEDFFGGLMSDEHLFGPVRAILAALNTVEAG